MSTVGLGPLAGVRIVDFTANMSGPMATMILGDQGADVVKVEPTTGDIIRSIGMRDGGVSAFFANLNNVSGGPRKLRIYVDATSELISTAQSPDASSVAPNYTYTGPSTARYIGRYVANPANQPIFEYYDINGTKKVDSADIGLVRSKFNQDYPPYDRSPGAATWAPGPPNGIVNGIDIGLVRGSFNHSCTAAP